MDYLRNVNNTWGHLAGDAVLEQIAKIMRREVRQGDVVARFGGEEIVIMLPSTDVAEAAYSAERIRAAIASHAFDIGADRTIRCTVSMGVASAPLHATDLTGLVEAADAAVTRQRDRAGTA